MKVRTKIALLLVVFVATCTAGLILLKRADRNRFESVASQREKERRESFDQFREHWSESLETLASYLSAWDPMVAAIGADDQSWAKANINDSILASYRAHAAWIYRPDEQLFFSHNSLYSDGLRELPLPPGAMAKLLSEEKFCHFFQQTPNGLIEVRGATIHPARDTGRVSPPQGYFFVGRLWGAEDLREISLFTSNTIRLVPMDEELPRPEPGRIDVVTFTRLLLGWDGQPLAQLVVRNDSATLSALHESSERRFLWLLVFGLVLLVLLVFSLTHWVVEPLKALSRALQHKSQQPIYSLQRDNSEFGDFARLIHDFFAQREKLLSEMSERRQAEEALHESEERLRHAQKMEAIGRLAGGVAHDFNNLLTAIIGYADMIAMDSRQDNVRLEAEQIRKAGEQAASLTRQLLAFSRKQILQPRVIDLFALVDDMKKLLQRVIGEHIELRVETSGEEARVRADATQLEQVVLNLAVNARDAMPQGGVVRVHVGRATVDQTLTDGSLALTPGEYVTLTVEDAGCGMDAQTRARIFEPFFTTKNPGKGTGLGLATVYGVVQQSGGIVTVRSSPGEGSTFIVYLPAESAPIDRPREVAPGPTRSRASETVLVVEDDSIVRELICEVLRKQGYVVLCASTGQEGLRLARKHRGEVELLISDVIMPELGGPQLARELLNEQPAIKVLFVSGYSDDEVAEQGVLPADVRYLEKPFSPEDLARKVREVLDEPAPQLV